MGEPCSTNGGEEERVDFWWEIPLRRPRRRWVDNIRMNLGEVGWGDGDWIGVAQDRNSGRAVVNSVLNLRFPWNAGKLSSGLTSSGLSSSAQLHRELVSCVCVCTSIPCYVRPLSSRHSASSGCGWKRRPPDMDISYEYIISSYRQSTGDGLEGWTWGWQLITLGNGFVRKCHKVLRVWADCLDKRPNLRKMDMRFGTGV
jgi:hypothetical protein